MAVAPMPVTLRAPLLPPLKAPVAVGEEFEDAPLEGVDVLLVVVPKPEDVREMERVVEVPFPEVEDEEEEMGSAMANALVWESVRVTSPTGEAWKVYPEPAGTTGITTVRFPSDGLMVFFKAKVLWKSGLVR